eukprot:CAMPEP_0178408032 /NCGR_PEP_ID=MMETSP0689_2-20121128/19731_1 /TAXON_ID=160604 /ORGANISM="Amphidinium massartii, Strain CS-259" /LENGTH=506 /DNA_ID=CAMNT_0020029117 /DNA_START=182 /DNA_END=1700 /DNA_ORIENTATION=-
MATLNQESPASQADAPAVDASHNALWAEFERRRRADRLQRQRKGSEVQRILEEVKQERLAETFADGGRNGSASSRTRSLSPGSGGSEVQRLLAELKQERQQLAMRANGASAMAPSTGTSCLSSSFSSPKKSRTAGSLSVCPLQQKGWQPTLDEQQGAWQLGQPALLMYSNRGPTATAEGLGPGYGGAARRGRFRAFDPDSPAPKAYPAGGWDDRTACPRSFDAIARSSSCGKVSAARSPERKDTKVRAADVVARLSVAKDARLKEAAGDSKAESGVQRSPQGSRQTSPSKPAAAKTKTGSSGMESMLAARQRLANMEQQIAEKFAAKRVPVEEGVAATLPSDVAPCSETSKACINGSAAAPRSGHEEGQVEDAAQAPISAELPSADKAEGALTSVSPEDVCPAEIADPDGIEHVDSATPTAAVADGDAAAAMEEVEPELVTTSVDVAFDGFDEQSSLTPKAEASVVAAVSDINGDNSDGGHEIFADETVSGGVKLERSLSELSEAW